MADTTKATWWSVTINNPTQEDRSLLKTPPDFIRKIEGQDEVGEGGTLHIQAYIQCKAQQRFSAIKAYLPRAHIQAARNIKALQQYVRKDDTAVPGTQFTTDNSATEYISPATFPRWLSEYFIDNFFSKEHELPDSVSAEWACEWSVRHATRAGHNILHLWKPLSKTIIQFWPDLCGYGELSSLDEFIKQKRLEWKTRSLNAA